MKSPSETLLALCERAGLATSYVDFWAKTPWARVKPSYAWNYTFELTELRCRCFDICTSCKKFWCA